MPVSITFPFVMVASDYHEFQDHLIFMEKMIAPNALPPATSKLAQLAYVELGGYSNDGYYAVMYSPSQLGKTLLPPDPETWEYCAPLLFDYFNEDYQKTTRAKNKADYIPFNKIPEEWLDHAQDDNMDFRALYDQWVAQKQHDKISAQLPQVATAKSKSKI
jgi:hypothetical protein